MHVLAVRRSFALLAVGALTATGLVIGPVAAETPSPAPAPVRKSAPVMAAGIIVTTTGSAPSAATLRKADSVLGDDNDVAKVLKRGGNTSILITSNRLSGAEAKTLAAELRLRPEVVSASPNYIRRAYADSPVVTDDTDFSSLKQIWDPRDKTDAKVKTVLGSTNKFPTGGYSSKAPALWGSTKGSGEVVAVIDTGITSHPELDSQVLPGYDFVSQYYDDSIGLEDTGRDGDGRDADPSDMGDWEEADYCYPESPAFDSSWHGTHVSGIIAAEGDNAQGIVGVAPSVKILPVRVLGLCGGTDQDIADGIRWAAGLSVPGVPTNANPADVINLSLGGFGKCSDSPSVASALAAAQASGSVVVAAAGNDGADIVKKPTFPATCPGVISVGATSEYGDRAGYLDGTKKVIYSNYGKTLDISAPGGDSFWDNRAILSTVNTGTTSPAAPGYAEYEGTSMATPVVSAAAALIRSTGTFTPAQTEAALKAAVAPFPTGKSSSFKKCTTSICGKGILDLSKVVAPTAGASISGSLAINETLTAVPGTWSVKPAAFKYQWLRDDVAVTGATAATYKVSAADIGHSVHVRISPSTGAFAPANVTAHTDPSNAIVSDGTAREHDRASDVDEVRRPGDRDRQGGHGCRAGRWPGGASPRQHRRGDWHGRQRHGRDRRTGDLMGDRSECDSRGLRRQRRRWSDVDASQDRDGRQGNLGDHDQPAGDGQDHRAGNADGDRDGCGDRSTCPVSSGCTTGRRRSRRGRWRTATVAPRRPCCPRSPRRAATRSRSSTRGPRTSRARRRRSRR